MSILPSASSLINGTLSLALVDPVSSLTFIPRGSNQSEKEEKCCSANISVGHKIAVCQSLDLA